MLSVNYTECRKQAHYVECRYAECRYAQCRGAGQTCQGQTLWLIGPEVEWVTNLSDETLELQLRQVVPVQGEAVRKRVQLFVLDLQLDLQKRKSALPCLHLTYYALPSDHLP
jgi:hypothetical protein